MHMNSIPEQLITPLKHLLLALADDKLMLGHRNSDWTGLGPILEEDIAFSALAQDEIAHAQAVYRFLSDITGKDENALAFGRAADEYRCATIVEPPDEFDWAVAIVRQFFCDHYDLLRLTRMAQSSHKPLADLAQRIADEEQVHVEHANEWIKRLGRGSSESQQRVQNALERLGPLTASLFEPIDGEAELEKANLYPPLDQPLHRLWKQRVEAVLRDAQLTADLPQPDDSARSGRHGVHSQAFTELLDEMCEVYRLEPDAAW